MKNDFKAVKKAFEGLDEGQRMLKANKFIKEMTDKGIPVNHCICYLKDAGVMSDTEIIHSLYF